MSQSEAIFRSSCFHSPDFALRLLRMDEMENDNPPLLLPDITALPLSFTVLFNMLLPPFEAVVGVVGADEMGVEV